MKAYKETQTKYYKDIDTKEINGVAVGSPTVNEGIGSGFTASIYYKTPNPFPPSTTSYEIVLKIMPTSATQGMAIGSETVGTSGAYWCPQLRMVAVRTLTFYSPKGATITGKTALELNKWYWIKLTWDGTQKELLISTDGETYTSEGTYNTTTACTGGEFCVGAGAGEGSRLGFSGQIDFSQSYIYINNSLWWRGTIIQTQETTQDDYEYSKEVDVYKLPKTGGVTKYYKYIETDWTQPILTSNGVLGGNSFACYGEYAVNQPCYYMFDGNDSSFAQYWATSINEFIFYNPNPLNITRLDFLYYPSTYITNGIIYGSNNTSDWDELAKFSHNANSATEILSYKEFYKYYKVKIISANGSTGSSNVIADIYTLNITATQQKIIEATQDDYDFSETREVKYYGITG